MVQEVGDKPLPEGITRISPNDSPCVGPSPRGVQSPLRSRALLRRGCEGAGLLGLVGSIDAGNAAIPAGGSQRPFQCFLWILRRPALALRSCPPRGGAAERRPPQRVHRKGGGARSCDRRGPSPPFSTFSTSSLSLSLSNSLPGASCPPSRWNSCRPSPRTGAGRSSFRSGVPPRRP